MTHQMPLLIMHTPSEMAGYLVTLLFGLDSQIVASIGFGLLAAAYVAFIVLAAHVVGFNHLEDE